jgi:transketolase N-terminal domain/subunit
VIVSESEDEKDPKRTRMVLSRGHELVGLGYSTSADAARVTDRGRKSDNPNGVGRVH